jgi:hypothetical protein
MVVLADEILESFFETDLAGSFRLESVPGIELPEAAPGLLGGLWSAVATADNRRMFNRLTDELGKTIGRHAVVHQPAIGRYTGTDEPKARESLLTFAMRHSARRGNLAGAASASSASVASSATAVAPALPKAAPAEKPALTPTSPEMPLLHAASAALMERATFAIDDVGDEDEEALSDGELGGGDDEVMDEVDAFLEAHDSGLSEADKALAKGAAGVISERALWSLTCASRSADGGTDEVRDGALEEQWCVSCMMPGRYACFPVASITCSVRTLPTTFPPF